MGGITYDADSEDRRYDEAVQREIDERAATLLDAYVDGRKAGRDLSSPEMNPHQSGSAKAEAWERGRLTTLRLKIESQR
jgi:hypothetical protein